MYRLFNVANNGVHCTDHPIHLLSSAQISYYTVHLCIAMDAIDATDGWSTYIHCNVDTAKAYKVRALFHPFAKSGSRKPLKFIMRDATDLLAPADRRDGGCNIAAAPSAPEMTS